MAARSGLPGPRCGIDGEHEDPSRQRRVREDAAQSLADGARRAADAGRHRARHRAGLIPALAGTGQFQLAWSLLLAVGLALGRV